MQNFFLLFFLSFFMLGCSFSSDSVSGSLQEPKNLEVWESYTFEDLNSSEKFSRAIFAGGCFWCSEQALEVPKGVVAVFSGYTGGGQESADYKKVSSGETRHREAAQVFYDPQKISYADLLTVYWKHINPTDSGGQFGDRGFQYTPAIFYSTDEEKKIAENQKKLLNESGKFSFPIVVPILPIENFFPSEEYHQDYYKKKSDHYNRYKKGSGREDYIHENWDNDTVLPKVSTLNFDTMKKNLTPLQYRVTQENGTERPFANEYWDNKKEGIYTDIVSGEVLFSSKDKFTSGTGWPSFTKSLQEKNVVELKDSTLGIVRTEVRSKNADSHLGHLFTDGPSDKGGLRYCINSASLNFIPVEDLEKQGYGKWLSEFSE